MLHHTMTVLNKQLTLARIRDGEHHNIPNEIKMQILSMSALVIEEIRLNRENMNSFGGNKLPISKGRMENSAKAMF